ncbi:MAG: hypothetical protein LBO09_02455 [Candidatus Peribacteria bacterium]|jgi:hypothetical protein|nr:hypothetical protein [Candidatus Peribacteria bacterium]
MEKLNYFFASYSYAHDGMSFGSGNTTIKINGVFPNRKELTSFLEKDLEKNFFGKCSVVIASIQRLTKEEYEAWIA